MDFYGAKRANDWLNLTTRETGATKANIYLLREYKEMDREFTRILVIAYFLMVDKGMDELHSLFSSAKKQRGFIRAVIIDLKKYKVDSQWEVVLDRDLEKLFQRVNYIYKIIRENVRLTDAYPYFKAVGFSRLIDFSITVLDDPHEENEKLLEEIGEWNRTHREEVDEYMESIADELARVQARKDRIAQAKADEKMAKKMARRVANDEVKEIRKNEKAYKDRQKKIEKSFAKYYK